MIPKTAVTLRDGKKVVFTLNGERARWNYVETGPENSSSIIITSGLAEGDLVVYFGNINLAHESPVKVIK